MESEYRTSKKGSLYRNTTIVKGRRHTPVRLIYSAKGYGNLVVDNVNDKMVWERWRKFPDTAALDAAFDRMVVKAGAQEYPLCAICQEHRHRPEYKMCWHCATNIPLEE